jgi:L-lysine 2,3-aminomutase
MCNEAKDDLDFSVKRTSSDGTVLARQSRCKECMKMLMKKHYTSNKDYYKAKARTHDSNHYEIFLEILKTKSCVDCGETDPVVLDFDHTGDKVMSIAHMLQKRLSWTTILAEMEKCEVRCANCHRRKTAKQLNWKRALL